LGFAIHGQSGRRADLGRDGGDALLCVSCTRRAGAKPDRRRHSAHGDRGYCDEREQLGLSLHERAGRVFGSATRRSAKCLALPYARSAAGARRRCRRLIRASARAAACRAGVLMFKESESRATPPPPPGGRAGRGKPRARARGQSPFPSALRAFSLPHPPSPAGYGGRARRRGGPEVVPFAATFNRISSARNLDAALFAAGAAAPAAGARRDPGDDRSRPLDAGRTFRSVGRSMKRAGEAEG